MNKLPYDCIVVVSWLLAKKSLRFSTDLAVINLKCEPIIYLKICQQRIWTKLGNVFVFDSGGTTKRGKKRAAEYLRRDPIWTGF